MQVVQTMSQERIAERMNSVGQIADVPVPPVAGGVQKQVAEQIVEFFW